MRQALFWFFRKPHAVMGDNSTAVRAATSLGAKHQQQHCRSSSNAPDANRVYDSHKTVASSLNGHGSNLIAPAPNLHIRNVPAARNSTIPNNALCRNLKGLVHDGVFGSNIPNMQPQPAM
jgi:hypothetical protein